MPIENVRIDVGANSGDNTEVLAEGDRYAVLAFEPVTYLFTRLRERFRGRNNIVIFPFVVTNSLGFKIFNVATESDGGASSLFDKNAVLQDLEQYKNDPQFGSPWAYQELVPSIRLQDIIELYSIVSIDFLHIDAQGSDLDVFKSLGPQVSRVKAGRMEVSYNLELYKGTNNRYSDAKEFLETCGYTVEIEYMHQNETEADLKFYR